MLRLFKELWFKFYRPQSKQHLVADVPYFSQWSSSNLVDAIYHKKNDARLDPKWRQSGAKDKLEYLHWSWSICGVTCLKMILAGKNIYVPLITLAKNGLKYGFYTINHSAYLKEDYVNSISNLRYKPFVSFINSTFPLQAKVVAPLALNEIIYHLDHDFFVIASVSAQIREPSSTPRRRGGHLVLIVGYNYQTKSFILNNPSGIYRKSQHNTSISFTDFLKFFGNKGIIVKYL